MFTSHFPYNIQRGLDRKFPFSQPSLLNYKLLLIICSRSSDFLLYRKSCMQTDKMSGTRHIRLFS